MSGSAGHLRESLISAIAFGCAVVAGMLPKRWWPALDRFVPVSDCAAASAILTILVAAAIGVPGFLSHTTQQVSRNNQLVLDAASREAARPEREEKLNPRDWGRMFVTIPALSLFTFILLTPAGWASTYLGLSGTLRGIAAAVGEPLGDPLLTGIDALVSKSSRDYRTRAATRARESLEGPEVPDRSVRGSQVGIPAADLVIVAARRKPGWDVGTAVDTGARWFRLIAIEERTIAGRLRTLYALREHTDLEVFRRRVEYTLPPDPTRGGD
jgi:hypothetical protein